MRVLVTGGAGFIGSHVALRLAAEGHDVRVLDSLVSAHPDALGLLPKGRVELQRGDLLDRGAVARALEGVEAVFHLAANPDVRATSAAPQVVFEANVVTTQNLLEAARGSAVRGIVFTSTSTVYGETHVVPTPETLGPLDPISPYGATKLAGEALLSAHAHMTGQRCTVLRLANVTGPRSTHGVVVDLVAKLRRDPKRLELLGDGTQRKSYVHIDDVVEGMLLAWQRQERPWDAFNIGSADTLDVRDIAGIVCRAMGLRDVRYEFKPSAGGRGWPGDVKVMQLDIGKLRQLGWAPRFTSAATIEAAARDAAAR